MPGGAQLGAWLSTREPLLAEAASKAGYDWVCVDLQHGMASEAELPGLLQAIALGGALPVVRVGANDAARIGRALDLGALAVIVPLVNGADDARRAVAACRYPPAGERSFGPVAAGVRRGGAADLREVDARVRCFVMVETAEGLDALEEIVAVPGVDGVYVGPADLSIALGLGAGLDQGDERFTAALARIVAACDRAGVIPGIHADATLAPVRVAAGFRWVNAGFDLAPALRALAGDLAAVRARIGGAVDGGE